MNRLVYAIAMEQSVVMQFQRLGAPLVVIPKSTVTKRYLRQYGHAHTVGFEGKLTSTDIVIHSLHQQRLDRQTEQICIITCAAMESADLSHDGACTLGEHQNRVTLLGHTAHQCLARLIWQRDRETIQFARHNVEDWVLPYIVLHHHHKTRRQRQIEHYIYEGLMVGYDHRRMSAYLDMVRIINGIMQSAEHEAVMFGQALHIAVITRTTLGIVAAYSEIEQRERTDQEKHGQTKIGEAEHRSPIHIDIAEQQCAQAKKTIENTDSREIICRTEMADTLLLRRIIDTDRHRYQLHIVPRGKNQQLQFRLIAARQYIQSVQFVQRIDAHTGLRIRQVDGGLQTKPEIGEAVGKLVLARHVLVRKLTTTDYQCARMDIQRTEQERYIFGIMLSVCIEGQRIVKAHLDGFAKSCRQRPTLAFVAGIRDYGNGKIQRLEPRQCIVGTTVVHHDNIVQLVMRTTHNIHDGTGIVIGRYQGTKTICTIS